LGLGSNAFGSTAYLPLAGGTISGGLTGTSATFNNSLTVKGGDLGSGTTIAYFLDYNGASKFRIAGDGNSIFSGPLTGTSATFNNSLTVKGGDFRFGNHNRVLPGL
jgi:hypothetical protein